MTKGKYANMAIYADPEILCNTICTLFTYIYTTFQQSNSRHDQKITRNAQK